MNTNDSSDMMATIIAIQLLITIMKIMIMLQFRDLQPLKLKLQCGFVKALNDKNKKDNGVDTFDEFFCRFN